MMTDFCLFACCLLQAIRNQTNRVRVIRLLSLVSGFLVFFFCSVLLFLACFLNGPLSCLVQRLQLKACQRATWRILLLIEFSDAFMVSVLFMVSDSLCD